MRFLQIIILVSGIVGCSQIPSFRSADNLIEYISETHYIVKNDVIYEEKKGFVNWFYGIRTGTYIPKYQDDEAYYFIGEGFSSCIGTKAKSGGCSSNIKGGLWISKTDPEDIRMYYIDGASEEVVDVNMGWVYYLTLGSIIVETPNKNFANQVVKYKNNI